MQGFQACFEQQTARTAGGVGKMNPTKLGPVQPFQVELGERGCRQDMLGCGQVDSKNAQSQPGSSVLLMSLQQEVLASNIAHCLHNHSLQMLQKDLGEARWYSRAEVPLVLLRVRIPGRPFRPVCLHPHP